MRLKTLPALIILSLSPLATATAQAMGFQNCAGKNIRVHIYNHKDRALAVALNGGMVKSNEVRIWHQGNVKKAHPRTIS